LEASGADARIAVAIEATAPVARVEVMANGVRVASRDEALPAGKSRVDLTFTLGAGANVVEARAATADGVESLAARRVVDGPARGAGAVYFVGFGVSHYADASLDLGLASKDAHDLEATLRAMAPGYREVKTKVFGDAAVTRSALESAHAFLAGAALDDTV